MSRSTRTCATRITILTNVFFAGRAVVFRFRCPAVTVLTWSSFLTRVFWPNRLGGISTSHAVARFDPRERQRQDH